MLLFCSRCWCTMSRRKQAKPQHINSEEQPPDAASGKGGARCFAARLMRGGGSGAISGGSFSFPSCFTLCSFPLRAPTLDPRWLSGGAPLPSGVPTAELLHGAARPGGGAGGGWCCLQLGPRGPCPGGLRCPASPTREPPPSRPAEQRRIPRGGRGVRRPRELRVRPRGRGPQNLPWGGKDFEIGRASGRERG